MLKGCFFASIWALAVFITGCGDEPKPWIPEEDAAVPDACPPGYEGCACTEEGGCNVALTCIDGTCVFGDTGTGDGPDTSPNCDHTCMALSECTAAGGTPVLGGTCADTVEVCCDLG